MLRLFQDHSERWQGSGVGEEMLFFVARRQFEDWEDETQRCVMRLNKAAFAEFLPRITCACVNVAQPCSLAGAVGLQQLQVLCWNDRDKDADGHMLAAQLARWTHLTNLRSFELMGRLPNRNKLRLHLHPSLSSLGSVSVLHLRQLALPSLQHLSCLSRLASLDLFDCRLDPVVDLPPLPSLRTLSCTYLQGIVDMQQLGVLQTGLQVLSLRNLHFGSLVLRHFEGLAAMASLQDLSLHGCCLPSLGFITSLDPLSTLTALKRLVIIQTDVTSLQPLAPLTQLQDVDLRVCRSLHDLCPLSAMHHLQCLLLSETSVVDVSPLAGLHSLNYLDLAGTLVEDLRPLAQLTKLERLGLSLCKRLLSVAPLAQLTGLKSLYMVSVRVPDLELLPSMLPLTSIDSSAADESADEESTDEDSADEEATDEE